MKKVIKTGGYDRTMVKFDPQAQLVIHLVMQCLISNDPEDQPTVYSVYLDLPSAKKKARSLQRAKNNNPYKPSRPDFMYYVESWLVNEV